MIYVRNPDKGLLEALAKAGALPPDAKTARAPAKPQATRARRYYRKPKRQPQQLIVQPGPAGPSAITVIGCGLLALLFFGVCARSGHDLPMPKGMTPISHRR
jgi:hypothetical protein